MAEKLAVDFRLVDEAFKAELREHFSDAELVELGTRELCALGLAEADQVAAGYVVRMPRAYPVYDEGFAEHVAVLRDWLADHVPNVHPVGRNGMHRYNNQDHSMVTAMLTVENILTGTDHDVWSVNVEADYHEEVAGGDQRAVGGTGRDAPVLPRAVNRRPGPPGAAPRPGSGAG